MWRSTSNDLSIGIADVSGSMVPMIARIELDGTAATD
jgi:hypothetical protein